MSLFYKQLLTVVVFITSMHMLSYPTDIQDGLSTPCLGCAITKGELDTIGGVLVETSYFQVRQDCWISIPGFMIVGSKRHVRSIDELTQQERADLIELLHVVRKGMRECLSIDTVYMIQEEDSSHFHVWLFPRYDWMQEFGHGIQSVKQIMQWAKEHLTTEEDMQRVKEAAETLKNYCKSHL